MQLKTLELLNYCQHQKLSVTFAPGLNAILGANGSGKSNLLTAAYAALTGDFSRNDGVQIDNIRKGAAPRDPSRITQTFVHSGRNARITRNLRSGKRELIIDEGTPITSDKACLTAILDLLDVDLEVLDAYVFVAQWEMFSIFEATPAKRAAAFQRLFRLDQASRIHRTLGDLINHKEPPVSALDRDEAKRRLQDLNEQLLQTEKALQLATDPATLLSQLGDIDQQLYNHERTQRLTSELETALREEEKVSNELNQAQTERDRLQQVAESLSVQLGASEEVAAVVLETFSAWKRYESSQTRIKTITAEIEKFNEELLQPEPQKPEDYLGESYEEMNNHYCKQSVVRDRLLTFLDVYNPEEGRTACPTCGTDAVSLVRIRQDAQERLKTYEETLPSLGMQLHRTLTYDLQNQRYNERMVYVLEQLTHLESSLQSIRTLAAKPSISKDDADLMVEDRRALSREYERAQTALFSLQKQISTNQGALLVHQAKIVTLNSSLVGVDSTLTDDHRETLQILRRQLLVMQTERAEIVGRLKALKGAQKDLQALVESAEAAYLAGQVDQAWHTHCMQLRDVFHHTAFPAKLTTHYLDSLQEQVNEYLELFQAPFRAISDETLSFSARFNNGNVFPAGRLSGGEKMILAIAFRLAVNNQFASQLGLLCLDEPTVGLDEKNLKLLETALERLRSLSQSTGLQVILVTHERSLAPLFDHVISL